MDDWAFEDEWDWMEDAEEESSRLEEICVELASLYFLSDNDYLPDALDDYYLDDLDTKDWWPLVAQLDDITDLELVLRLSLRLEDLLGLTGVPTELLEDPFAFLESVLQGHLPLEASGRKVGSRKLVKISLLVVELMREFPEVARSAVRAWANVHRHLMEQAAAEYEQDMADMLLDADLPPAMTGFSMMIALTLMRWPRRAEGLPLPPEFDDPDLYDEVLIQWEALPDSHGTSSDEVGHAEALFAQGQLAHMLAQMGTVELLHPEDLEEQEASLAYSRLSRAILWVHDRCRFCPEREGVTCRVASDWPERPVPLLDVAGEVANTGRVQGCIQM